MDYEGIAEQVAEDAPSQATEEVVLEPTLKTVLEAVEQVGEAILGSEEARESMLGPKAA